MTETTTYKLPKRFVNDHIKRSCLRQEDGSGYGMRIGLDAVLAEETKAHYFVNLTIKQAQELLSDADYYAFYSDQPDIGLRASARATHKALIAQGVTPKPKKQWGNQ